MFTRVWVVQEPETGKFLTPYDGDVGYTTWIRESGFFDSEEAAIDTAEMLCDSGFHVYSFYIVK